MKKKSNFGQSYNNDIEGVFIEKREKIADERGTVLHGVRSDQLKNTFGEVYFKKLYKDVVNGWHVHETLKLNYLCIHGMIKLVLCDMRKDSPTYMNIKEIFFGEDNHCMVHIPPGVANGSKGMVSPYSIMCNVCSEAHNPKIKYKRIDPHSDEIPYDWERQDY
jgi:dTDP-4-dehydrorhamnose 3,5-epimerase